MFRKTSRLIAVVATAAIVVAACGGDDDTDTADAADTTAAAGDGEPANWTVNTDDCVDPDRTNAPIEGTINIAASPPCRVARRR